MLGVGDGLPHALGIIDDAADLLDALAQRALEAAGAMIANEAGVVSARSVRVDDRTSFALRFLYATNQSILFDVAGADLARGEMARAVARWVLKVFAAHVRCNQLRDDGALKAHAERAVIERAAVVEPRVVTGRHGAIGIAC